MSSKYCSVKLTISEPALTQYMFQQIKTIYNTSLNCLNPSYMHFAFYLTHEIDLNFSRQIIVIVLQLEIFYLLLIVRSVLVLNTPFNTTTCC
jgi:hypothetical protein